MGYGIYYILIAPVTTGTLGVFIDIDKEMESHKK
jgi:hypothetical protein